MFALIWLLAFVLFILSLIFKAVGNMTWTQVLIVGAVIGVLVGLMQVSCSS